MELEISNPIRQKVSEAEGMRVTWSKDRVWNQVVFPEKKINWKVYLVAAAILFVGIALIFVGQNRSQVNTDLKIQMLEAELAKAGSVTATLEKTHTKTEPPCIEVPLAYPVPVATLPAKRAIRRVPATTAGVTEEKSVPVDDNRVADTGVGNPEKITPLVSQETKSQTTLKAILGVIPSAGEQKMTKTKNTRIKIQFLKPTLPTGPGEQVSEREPLTARIN